MDAEDIPALSGRSLASTLRELLITNPLPAEFTQDVDDEIDRLLGGLCTDDSALIQAVWRQDRVVEICDNMPGLRALLRTRACGGVLPAITDLLARAVRRREREASLVVIHEGNLLIPEHLFTSFVHLLEVNRYGAGPGFVDDPDVDDLVRQPEGPGGLWKRWAQWAGGLLSVTTWVACARWPGAFPCVSVPARSERIASVVTAARQAPTLWPVSILPQPQLWPWPVIHSSGIADLIGRFRSPLERRVFSLTGSVGDLRQALDIDPVAAWSAMTARWAPGDVLLAMVRLLRQAAASAACMNGTADATGVIEVLLRANGTPLAPVRLLRRGSQLAISADGLVAVATWLGVAPWRYTPIPGDPFSWDWASMADCGWKGLIRDGLLEPVQVHGQADLWFALPPGGIPRALPTSTMTWSPLTRTRENINRMRFDAPWSPPDS